MAQTYTLQDPAITEFHAPGLTTTPLFWDCDCERDYIHPAAQNECPVCGAIREEQPDSHVNEVLSEYPH